MTSFIGSKNLTQLGTAPVANLDTLRRAVEVENGCLTAHLACTLKSYYRSPALVGDISSRCSQLLRAPHAPASAGRGLPPHNGGGYQAAVQQGVRVGIDFAAAARLSGPERRRALGPYHLAYDVAAQMMRRDDEERQQVLERLNFSSPAQLNAAILCADGYFYEQFVVLGTALERQGVIDCCNYPDITPKQWEQLAPMMPLLHAHVGNLRQLGSIATAWLKTGSPYESILESDAWAFYADTAEEFRRGGRHFEPGPRALPEALQRCALEHLHVVAKERWSEFLSNLYDGRTELTQIDAHLPEVVNYLALELAAPDEAPLPTDVDRVKLPPMPLSVRIGLARALTDSDLSTSREGLIRSAMGYLCSQSPESGEDRVLRFFDESSCSSDVIGTTRAICYMDDNEIQEILGAVNISRDPRSGRANPAFKMLPRWCIF